MTEELLAWLTSSEGTLAAMEEDPLPLDASVIEEMLNEHQVSIALHSVVYHDSIQCYNYY